MHGIVKIPSILLHGMKTRTGIDIWANAVAFACCLLSRLRLCDFGECLRCRPGGDGSCRSL